MAKVVTATESACPYIDANDTRCAQQFSLRRLEQAFHVCANGGYERCPIYHQLLREQQRREPNRLTITITLEGHEPPRPGRRLTPGARPRLPERPGDWPGEQRPAPQWQQSQPVGPAGVPLRATGS